jgi:O-antigen/teichoic acid export membrane protein
VSSVIGALAGLLSWIIATRLVDPAEIGKASQFVSALLLVAGAMQLNLDVGLMRWLRGAGRHAGRLVWRTMLLVIPLAAVVGLVYAVLLPGIGRSAAGDASPWFGVALFVLAAAGWCVFTLHDSLLVALSRPWWTVWRNGVFAISRIGLLVALGVLGFGAQGIVLSRLPSRLAAAARRRLLVVFLPLLALGALVAAPALELVFAAAYAEAADVLRLLLVGMAFRLVVLHERGVRQALGRAMAYARLQLTSTVLVTAVVIAVPVGRGTVADLLPVALGYVVVQALCMLTVLMLPVLRRLTRTTPRRDDDLTRPTQSH